MDIWFYSALIILIFIILIYIITSITLYYRSNPVNINNLGLESTVTYTSIGTRGDMGNQLFQLACLIAANKRYGAKIVLPSIINTLPLIELFDLSRFEIKDVIPDAIYYEYDNYENIIIPTDGRIYDIRGYRQAYKYFEDHSTDIRELLRPKAEILDIVRNALPTEYIAVHIRKGDYIKWMHNIWLLREFRRCQLKYYQEGIRKMRELYPECSVLVCTDSPTDVIPMLSELDTKAELAPIINGISPKFSDFCILYLSNAMTMSNSSYSFWAAYLNPGRTIICPSPWWDEIGFMSTGLNLSGPYLHHSDWLLLDTDTGNVVREPNSLLGEKEDLQHETLNLYRLIRGFIV